MWAGEDARALEDTGCRMGMRMWHGLMQNAYRFVGSRRGKLGKLSGGCPSTSPRVETHTAIYLNIFR